MRKGSNLKRKGSTQLLGPNDGPDTHLGPCYTLSYVILIIILTHRVVTIYVVQMKHLGMREVK